MIAFEVSVNGERRYVAGHTDARMLSIWMHGNFTVLPVVHKSFGVHTSIAVPGAAEGDLHTLSYPGNRLSVGDEVTIRIIEVDRADPPTKRNTGEGSVEIVADAG
jgi:hypothetical protein